MSWRSISAIAVVVILLGLLAIGPLHVGFSQYDRRNGAAEALDDATVGLPAKLYFYRR